MIKVFVCYNFIDSPLGTQHQHYHHFSPCPSCPTSMISARVDSWDRASIICFLITTGDLGSLNVSTVSMIINYSYFLCFCMLCTHWTHLTDQQYWHWQIKYLELQCLVIKSAIQRILWKSVGTVGVDRWATWARRHGDFRRGLQVGGNTKSSESMQDIKSFCNLEENALDKD